MGGTRMAVYALLLLIALVAVDWGFQEAGRGGSADASVVYCLLPAHRESLVSAAVSLRLARPGSTAEQVRVGGRHLTLAAWRDADDAGFRRACDALAAASQPAPAAGASTGTGAILAVLVPVIAGALLTLAADDFRQASDRRWTLADELRSDWREFYAAVLAYAQRREKAASGGIPAPAAVDERRRFLSATLRKIHVHRRRSPTIRNLQDTLASGSLGPAIAEGWAAGDTLDSATERRNRTDQIRGDLSNALAAVEKIASALERRIWLSSRL
jgi:hypothetical protein